MMPRGSASNSVIYCFEHIYYLLFAAIMAAYIGVMFHFVSIIHIIVWSTTKRYVMTI